MGKLKPVAAALLLAGLAIAFSWRYLETYGRETPHAPTPSPLVPPMNAHFRESLVGEMSKRITDQVMRYRMDHGTFPPADDFWKSMDGYCAPLHNPLNGSDKVVPMSADRDADYSDVGWVYVERGGMVFPGVVFNASRPRPATQP